MPGDSNQLKRADLIGAVGAGLLGAGLALLLDQALKPYIVPLLVLGLLSHGWGMYEKHRLETQAGMPTPRWAQWLYWGCWLALAALAIYVVTARL